MRPLESELDKETIAALVESVHWFDYAAFYDDIAARGYQRFVELGVWKGKSLAHLARRAPGTATVFGIDVFDDDRLRSWDAVATPVKAEQLAMRLVDYTLRMTGVREKTVLIKNHSVAAADMFGDKSVDFVYIDTSHEYHETAAEINAWLPKIRKHGTLAGHDYTLAAGVKQAVHEKFGTGVKILNDFELPHPIGKTGVWVVDL